MEEGSNDVYKHLTNERHPVEDYITIMDFETFTEKDHSQMQKYFAKGVIYIYDETVPTSWNFNMGTIFTSILPEIEYDAQGKYNSNFKSIHN